MKEFNGTPHNSAKNGQIAKTVLMPGDPLRAKLIAETYLENAICYTTIRNVFGYTGTYKGKEISVQASGMGVPSMGIYSYELYNFYDVENIIRIGSAGAFNESLNLGDIVVGQSLSTDSNYAHQYNLPGTLAPSADFHLIETFVNASRERNHPVRVGNILTSDVFYNDDNSYIEKWAKMGVLCVEMEAVALYCNAMRAGKSALCVATISDNLITHKKMTANERQMSFENMIEIALDTAIRL